MRRAAGPGRDALRELAGLPTEPRGEPTFTIALDYPVDSRPRHGYGRPAHPGVEAVLAQGHASYADRLTRFLDFCPQLLAIPLVETAPTEPYWTNGWYCGLDALALYCSIAIDPPARFVEIGSGNSTKYARRAIRDHGLTTHVTSIDPHPRAEVDELCDRVIRQGLEDVDLAVFDELAPGDICFLDGSHRVFMNSDATVFFTEVLPRLRPGVLIHVHDVFLPWDYPAHISDWWYSEQYLLSCWLLAGNALEIVLPDFYVSTHPDLQHILDPVWDELTWAAVATNGTGFWFRKRSP